MSPIALRQLRIQLAGQRQAALERGRNRLMIVGVMFACLALAYGVRLVNLGLAGAGPRLEQPRLEAGLHQQRADILDRNGMVLARSLKVSSLYVDSKNLKSDPAKIAVALNRIFPERSVPELKAILTNGKTFNWIKRKMTPSQWQQVFDLGEPTLQRKTEYDRYYPNRTLAAHVLGTVDTDGNGTSGLELTQDARLLGDVGKPITLTIDARAQHALTDSLAKAMAKHSAVGASGVIMDVRDGSLVAMVSLPDYNPNERQSKAVYADPSQSPQFNRATLGTYELGSTFKAFTVAMALEAGTVTIRDGYDCTRPLRVARFTIKDDHPKKRYLTVPEIFKYSSNIGTAQMADELGMERQRAFLDRMGMLTPVPIELRETGRPILPEPWGRLATMTVGYGHGMAVTQLHLATGFATLVNGGIHNTPTLLAGPRKPGQRVLGQAISDEMRAMLRQVVLEGTASKANAEGFRVGGKTGTAEKPGRGGYQRKSLISTFAGVFPMDAPRYVIIASLDEPKGIKETFGFAGAGWVAAPVVKDVVMRVGPALGVDPNPDLDVDIAHLGTDKERADQHAALLEDGR
jgi:cell division protein FtsI (penicillin-binding protein 3)